MITTSRAIPANVLSSYESTLQGSFINLEQAQKEAMKERVNARLGSAGGIPLSSLEELTHHDRLARFIEDPRMFLKLLEDVNLGVSSLQPFFDALMRGAAMDEIVSILKRLEVNPTELAPYLATLSGDKVGAYLYYQHEHSAALVFQWPLGGRTDFHEHGNSKGVSKVVKGTLEERLARKDLAGRMSVFNTLQHAAGSVFTIAEEVYHSVGALGSEPVLDIHAYWPPLI